MAGKNDLAREKFSTLAEQFGNVNALRVGGSVEPEAVHTAADVHYLGLELHHWAGQPGLKFHSDRFAHFKFAVNVSGKSVVAAVEAVPHDGYLRAGGLRRQYAYGMVAVLALRTAPLLRKCW